MVLGNMFQMFGASEKIVRLMRHVPQVNTVGGSKIPEESITGTIEFKEVYFSYPTKQDVRVCNGLNLKVEENKVIALVGPSGCGKSSVIALIERFYDAAEGEILFSGVNIKQLDPRWYRT